MVWNDLLNLGYYLNLELIYSKEERRDSGEAIEALLIERCPETTLVILHLHRWRLLLNGCIFQKFNAFGLKS